MTNTISPRKHYTTTSKTSTTTPNPVTDPDFTIMYYRYNKPKLYPKNGQDTEYYAFEDAKELDTYVFKSTNRQKVEASEKPMIDLKSATKIEAKIDPKTVPIDPKFDSTSSKTIEPKIDSKVDISKKITKPKIEPRNRKFDSITSKTIEPKIDSKAFLRFISKKFTESKITNKPFAPLNVVVPPLSLLPPKPMNFKHFSPATTTTPATSNTKPRKGNFLDLSKIQPESVPSTFYDVPLAPQDAVVNLDVPIENPIFDEVHFHNDPVNPVFQPISIPNIFEESQEETTTEITKAEEEEDTTNFSNDNLDLDALEIEDDYDSTATEQTGLKPVIKLKLQGGKIKELVAISVLPVEVKEDFKPRKETELQNRDIYRYNRSSLRSF